MVSFSDFFTIIFIDSLRISHVQIMSFDYIYPQILSLTSSSSTPIFHPPHTEFNLCCLYTHGCGAISWSVVNLPGTVLKKTGSPFHQSHHLQIVPQLLKLYVVLLLLLPPFLLSTLPHHIPPHPTALTGYSAPPHKASRTPIIVWTIRKFFELRQKTVSLRFFFF